MWIWLRNPVLPLSSWVTVHRLYNPCQNRSARPSASSTHPGGTGSHFGVTLHLPSCVECSNFHLWHRLGVGVMRDSLPIQVRGHRQNPTCRHVNLWWRAYEVSFPCLRFCPVGDFGGSWFLPQERAPWGVPPPCLSSSQGLALKQTTFTFCCAISLHLEALRSHSMFQIKAGGDPCSIAPQEGPFWRWGCHGNHSASHLASTPWACPSTSPPSVASPPGSWFFAELDVLALWPAVSGLSYSPCR